MCSRFAITTQDLACREGRRGKYPDNNPELAEREGFVRAVSRSIDIPPRVKRGKSGQRLRPASSVQIQRVEHHKETSIKCLTDRNPKKIGARESPLGLSYLSLYLENELKSELNLTGTAVQLRRVQERATPDVHITCRIDRRVVDACDREHARIGEAELGMVEHIE